MPTVSRRDSARKNEKAASIKTGTRSWPTCFQGSWSNGMPIVYLTVSFFLYVTVSTLATWMVMYYIHVGGIVGRGRHHVHGLVGSQLLG